MGIAAFAGVTAPAWNTYACSDSEKEVYRSSRTVWCAEQAIIDKFGAFPQEFFPYGDNVIDELVALFHVPAEGIYTFEASVENGSAHTGSECCGTGVTVTGDAFYNDAYNARGFWGYLLSLHETVNDWTGQVSGGWPTDFWADHISAFPNSMDWHIMDALGTKDNDSNLKTAAAAQKKRFYPGGDQPDPRVGMFDTIFALPNYGFDGLSRVFGYVTSDELSWDGLGVANPDVKRTEYVIAYLSLGARKPVTSIMQAAHVGDGTSDGVKGDATYTVDESHIDAIANAHCAIAAAGAQGVNVSSARSAFRSGDYAGVNVKGQCGTGCPSECGCNSAENLCVAPWLGDPTTSGGTDADGGTGPGNGGNTGDGGGSHPDAGKAHGYTGNGTTPDSADITNTPSGCACRTGARGETSWLSVFAALGVIGIAFARSKRVRA